MKLRIRSKLLISFMLMVALIIALVAFALLSMRILAEGNRRLVYVEEKASLVSDLQITLDRAVTALAEYFRHPGKARRATFARLILLYKRQMETLERYEDICPEGGADIVLREREKVAELKAEIEKIDATSRELMALADTLEKEKGYETIRNAGEILRGVLASEPAGEENLPQPAENLKTLGDVLGVSTKEAQKRLEELARLSKTLSRSRWQGLLSDLMESKDRALEAIGEIRGLTESEGKIAVRKAALAGREARKYMTVGAVLIVTLGVGLALYLSRSFSKPVLELEKGARLIGEGDFSHRMEIATGDEIEELASRFNTMARKLDESYRDLERKVRDRTRELERSNAQLRRLFNGISDGISVIRRDYRIVNANEGTAGIVGKKVEEFRGEECYRAYGGCETPCDGCPAEETFKNGVASSAQLRWATPGEKEKEMEICTFPLLEEKGEVTHVIEYAKDISDKKAMENKLFQSAKLAGIGTLAAGVAHEIRNPLGIIKTSADMIKRKSREGERNLKLSEFIIEEVDRLNRVVGRLLNFAKPSRPAIAPCDIRVVMERALALVGPQYRLQDLEIVRNYGEDIPPVLGDNQQLCQVFLNLIINAAQAMPAGGRLTLSTDAEGREWASASVSDTGSGIDEAILESIFDPFFTTKDEGSGLGLAIVYRIVEAQRGRVAVRSTRGKGTTFTVSLPAA